jgi:RNA polymerase sigma-70 factor, ECF subfamily
LCAKGNRDAFSVLYDRYFKRLCAFANGYLKDPDAAQDAVQEVFTRFIHQSGKFDASRSFSAWIFQVTKNQCLNVLRNEENRLRLRKMICVANSDFNDTSSVFDYRQIVKRVEAALAAMSNRDREIYRLRFEEERSIRDIAEFTHTPEGTVKSAIFYMLKKISSQLKEFIHE